MENKGITKRQFWIQMAPLPLYLAAAILWIHRAVHDGTAISWILALGWLVIILIWVITLVIQRKRHPIEDAELDEKVTRNYKEGMKGAGYVFAFIAFGFLLAIALYWLIK